MKAFLYSVLGAIISGIVVFLVQQYLSEKPLAPKTELTYAVEDSLLELDKKDLVEISKAVDEVFGRVTVAIISVKNTGNQALGDQEAIVRAGQIGEGDQSKGVGAGIVKYGTLSFPGKDSDSLMTEINDGRIVLKYKVLNPGEAHRFWIVYNDIGNVTFSARRPGLSLVEDDLVTGRVVDAEESTIDTFGDILGWGLVGLIIFVVGMLAALAGLTSDLKGRGYDLSEMLKAQKLKPEDQKKDTNA